MGTQKNSALLSEEKRAFEFCCLNHSPKHLPRPACCPLPCASFWKDRAPHDQFNCRNVAVSFYCRRTRSRDARRRAWFQSSLATVLQRDVRDLTSIAHVTSVPRLLSVIAARAGSLLNFADLSRTLALPQTTLKRYFALLEATFLVQLLQPWSGNLGQRAIQTPKVYLNDSGLPGHLQGLDVEGLKMDSTLAGVLLENFVLMELRKQAASSRRRPEFYFWRTASGQEVDIVLEDKAGRLVGIEIKAGATLGDSDVKGLQAMAGAAGKRWIRGVVLYTGNEIIPFAANLHALPLSHLWTPRE